MSNLEVTWDLHAETASDVQRALDYVRSCVMLGSCVEIDDHPPYLDSRLIGLHGRLSRMRDALDLAMRAERVDFDTDWGRDMAFALLYCLLRADFDGLMEICWAHPDFRPGLADALHISESEWLAMAHRYEALHLLHAADAYWWEHIDPDKFEVTVD